MDLKSMLNESTVARRPPTQSQILHQPTRNPTYPSYQYNDPSALSHHLSRRREGPLPPPRLQPPGSCSSSTGYGSAQSPSQHTLPSTASIHDGESHSAVGSSPEQKELVGPRDAPLYNNPYPPSFVPSPPSNVSSPQNQGPLLQYQQQQQQRPPSGIAATTSPFNMGVPRESPTPLNGPPHTLTRQYSPRDPHTSLLGTPLGPPAPLQKPSPQATQRAPSQGLEHMRTNSGGSLGSPYGGDHNDRAILYHQQTPSRESSVTRYLSGRDREKSVSVSPKTIPQPSPLRQASMGIPQPTMASPGSRPSIQSNVDPALRSSSVEARFDVVTSSSSETNRDLDHGSSPHHSPMPPKHHSTPPSSGALPPAQSHPATKRNASAISGSPPPPYSPRKRSRPTEIPIFARTARPNKPPLKLIMKESERPASHVPASAGGQGPPNGNVSRVKPSQTIPVTAAPPMQPSDWEPSIMGSIPYDELTRYICDMIFNTIGHADPPAGGAVFEIEAKLGEIHDIEQGRRIRLPVMTETIFDKNKFGPPTRFESSMNVDQHRTLNTYLNTLCAESQLPPRTPMFYDHPRETDTFYSLTAAGEASLPHSIRRYLNPKHRPRVRITTWQPPGASAAGGMAPAVKRRIIKSRIADFDVLCPSLAFDYRISISIESPFEGPDDVLVKINDVSAGGGADREKDRVSYRHLAYQIDLTQVSYPNSSKREHELEIEISTETIRQELANLREGRPNRYEDLVRGFVDNVRILARKGTFGRTG